MEKQWYQIVRGREREDDSEEEGTCNGVRSVT